MTTMNPWRGEVAAPGDVGGILTLAGVRSFLLLKLASPGPAAGLYVFTPRACCSSCGGSARATALRRWSPGATKHGHGASSVFPPGSTGVFPRSPTSGLQTMTSMPQPSSPGLEGRDILGTAWFVVRHLAVHPASRVRRDRGRDTGVWTVGKSLHRWYVQLAISHFTGFTEHCM